jgi:hypothetical protein
MSPGVQRRVDEHPNGPLFERDPTDLATAFGLDRDHEAQIVSLVVRCDLPATGRRDRDERHHASVFMAGQEHGIRMSDSHSRRVTVMMSFGSISLRQSKPRRQNTNFVVKTEPFSSLRCTGHFPPISRLSRGRRCHTRSVQWEH